MQLTVLQWATVVLFLGMRPAASTSSDDTTSCLYCSELWCISAESWIQCETCQQWAHTACAGVTRKQRHFICELCE